MMTHRPVSRSLPALCAVDGLLLAAPALPLVASGAFDTSVSRWDFAASRRAAKRFHCSLRLARFINPLSKPRMFVCTAPPLSPC
jgi:hypothetical protein